MRKGIFVAVIMICCASVSWAHISLIKDYHVDKTRQDVVIKTEKVSGNIYVLFGQGGNIGVSSGKDGILMIDDQFERIADKIKASLKELGSERPRFLFNTHWHGDHTGGNPIFGKDSIILAHNNVRKRLSTAQTVMGNNIQPIAAIGLPLITYNEGLSIHFNGEEVRAVHFPSGHTDGDTVIFFTGSNVVHLGDDFFAGRFPFVDLNSGGSVAGLIKNIGELVKQIPSDAKLIPGHGAVSTLNDLKTYHQTLIETTDIVRQAMQKNKSLEEIKKAGFPEKYKEWGTGFIKADRWIETIYNSYSVSMNNTKK
ncbi:MAG: MBL fold metallo-hydrolase [Acidobacteria bacterium]|nr:MBL fold metallo-hydrolase [Acidobacteriota bacterium]MCA1636861.1 MBL fold metallo-hydrolase [Acidobacteriota bacterium]